MLGERFGDLIDFVVVRTRKAQAGTARRFFFPGGCLAGWVRQPERLSHRITGYSNRRVSPIMRPLWGSFNHCFKAAVFLGVGVPISISGSHPKFFTT
jgi:hypothetical protein